MGHSFRDRHDAAQRLVPRIKAALRAGEKPIILALPRGGVPLGAVIAAALDAPLDLVFVRKLGLPDQPELAVGAVTNGAKPNLEINEEIAQAADLSRAEIAALAEPALAEIARRRALWLGGRDTAPLNGQVVVVVDDGIATGASMRAALRWLRAQGAVRVIVAIPVAPATGLSAIESLADQVICLETPHPFHAVGVHYADFPQVSDAEVGALLRARSRT
jgi:putative phosphoribosyl transferase